MLAASDTLAVWERAGAARPLARPVALLAALGAGGAAALPLGRRDAALLRLHAETFGDAIDGLAECPACGTAVELTVSCAALLAGADGAAPAPLDAAGHTVTWRLPSTEDLLALEGCDDAADAGLVLLRRCVVGATRDGEPVPAEALPEPVRAAVADAMAAADPLAEILLDLACPACAHAWATPLDVAEFVWRRLANTAHRLLREIHTLARAYGWTEAEVLALSPARRAAYLRLVNGG